MKSPFRRSTKVLYRILIYSFFSNASIGVFAFWFALSWHLSTNHWFQLPLELLGKSYAVVLVMALLAREEARNQMNSTRGSFFEQIDTQLDFLDPAYLSERRRRFSGEASEVLEPPEDVARFLLYRRNAGRRSST